MRNKQQTDLPLLRMFFQLEQLVFFSSMFLEQNFPGSTRLILGFFPPPHPSRVYLPMLSRQTNSLGMGTSLLGTRQYFV